MPPCLPEGVHRVVYASLPPYLRVYIGWYMPPCLPASLVPWWVYASLPPCLPGTMVGIPPCMPPGYTLGIPTLYASRVHPGYTPPCTAPSWPARGWPGVRHGALGSRKPKALGGGPSRRSGAEKCQRSYASRARMLEARARRNMKDWIARGGSKAQGALERSGAQSGAHSGPRIPRARARARGLPARGPPFAREAGGAFRHLINRSVKFCTHGPGARAPGPQPASPGVKRRLRTLGERAASFSARGRKRRSLCAGAFCSGFPCPLCPVSPWVRVVLSCESLLV